MHIVCTHMDLILLSYNNVFTDIVYFPSLKNIPLKTVLSELTCIDNQSIQGLGATRIGNETQTRLSHSLVGKCVISVSYSKLYLCGYLFLITVT